MLINTCLDAFDLGVGLSGVGYVSVCVVGFVFAG